MAEYDAQMVAEYDEWLASMGEQASSSGYSGSDQGSENSDQDDIFKLSACPQADIPEQYQAIVCTDGSVQCATLRSIYAMMPCSR